MEDLWDVKRLAQHLGVTERTVYNKLRSGQLPAIRVGRRWRFRPDDIDAWLDSQRPHGALQPITGRESADRGIGRSELETLLAGVDDPVERRLAFAGLLSRACRDAGWREPVVVGGHAVEFYTAGGYTTVDLDLVAATEAVDDILSAWGFERDGRHWYDEPLGILVEAPGRQLDPEQEERTLDVEVRGEHVAVLGIEDLVIDRLNACVHWSSEESCEWARVLVGAYRDRIDWEYLRARARAEDVEGALADVESSG